jgi:cytochrome P450 family 150 subfamily A5
VDIDSLDYFKDPLLALDPYSFLDYLAEHRPVYREPHHGVVVVTGHEEVIAVLRAPDLFSSATIVAGTDPLSLFPVRPEGDDITDFVNENRQYLPQNDQIVSADPPGHTAQRALLMGLITPKRLKENEEFIWRLTDRQLDAILPRGSAEIIGEYAQPYTLLVIADLLGVPEEDHPMLLGAMGESLMPGTASRQQREQARKHAGHNTLEVFYDYFSARIEERRRQPGTDVLTGMATAKFPDGSTPEPLEAARIASNLFAAGQETTVRLIGTLLRRIADEPQTQARLRANRDLIPRFVEETLRTEGPIKGEFRLAVKTTELGGVPVPAGTTVFVANAAAGRDSRQFECPAEFRIERENVRRHLGFGHGIHTCPGAPLARSEARITIERLLDRTTDIRISEEAHGPAGNRSYKYMRTYMFRGLTSLHLEFTTRD